MTTAKRSSVGIVTLKDDLHAHAVSHTLAQRGIDCHIIDASAPSTDRKLNWTSGAFSATVCSLAGRRISLDDVNLLWWRRGTPALHSDGTPRGDFVVSETRAALLGVVLTKRQGAIIDDPLAITRASNKLLQLEVATRAGFRVPKTLVSQDPEEVRRFAADVGGPIIAKGLTSSPKEPILTIMVTPDRLKETRAISAAPAIYQEYIDGVRHLRICVFGESVYAIEIESSVLDWRPDLRVPMRVAQVERDLGDKLQAVLKRLGLSMGVCDFKVTPDGEPIWLEVNPQGQFLFLEALVGISLCDKFCDFLASRLNA